MSIPNFILFKGGRQVDQVLGAVGRQGLEALIMGHMQVPRVRSLRARNS
jgi:thioredoxin-like negative regulator of GroEL